MSYNLNLKSVPTLTFNMTLSMYNITLNSFNMKREENLLTLKNAVKNYFNNEIVKSVKVFSVSSSEFSWHLNSTIQGVTFICGLTMYDSNNLQAEAFYNQIVDAINQSRFDLSMFHLNNENTSDIYQDVIFDEPPVASDTFVFKDKDDDDFLQPNVDIIVEPQSQPIEWFLIYLFALFIIIKFCWRSPPR